MKPFVIPKVIEPQKKAQAARPPGGTPDHLRQAKVKQRLERAGGKRLSYNLTAQALQDIETIKAREGLTAGVDAVIAALRHYARRAPIKR